MSLWVHHYRCYGLLLLVGCLPLLLLFALQAGPVTVGWADLLADTAVGKVFWHIRLPRIVLALLVGAVLGMAGAALQGLFRNPLADPGLIGVSSGAALAVVTVIVLGFANFLIPFAAFAGGILASFIVYQAAQRAGGADMATLLLAGVAVNSLCGAGIGLLIFISDDVALRSLTFWTMGSLGGVLWHNLLLVLPLLLGPLWLLWRQRNGLNALTFGEREAFYQGVDPMRLKAGVVLAVACAVGAAVSLCGLIGFVGLVAPHLVRMAFSADHRLLLPVSGLVGALLLLLADTLARTLVAPAELPIGLITSLIGGPFFLFLLWRGKRHVAG